MKGKSFLFSLTRQWRKVKGHAGPGVFFVYGYCTGAVPVLRERVNGRRWERVNRRRLERVQIDYVTCQEPAVSFRHPRGAHTGDRTVLEDGVYSNIWFNSGSHSKT